ncbi:MAG: type ISP restriction/modification enzyme [Candidatus Eisenbacteria bacterium]
MPEHPIEQYLTDLRDIRGTRANVPETSFYPALEHLLTDIGKKLSPKVRCVIHIANRGAGLPDAGLFTADQLRRTARNSDSSENPLLVQIPSRGVVEAKPPSDNLVNVAESEQVERYWKRYGTVLVTNFREFALVGSDSAGQPRILETFSLADTEREFWELVAHPQKTATEHGERMFEYLRRVLLHNAPLSAPQDVAALLASYAHDARIRIERADLPAISSLREALEEALGLRFEGEKGEHFFRSTLVQTLFYGLFSAWVLWARRHDAESGKTFANAIEEKAARYDFSGEFDWKSAHWLLRVPMLRALFMQVADPSRLGALDLIEVLDWTEAALNRVDRGKFFTSFDEDRAVQYFYEPFLQAFDQALRKDLGVWYTPEEVVSYQVERVDAVLRSELGVADGLADPKVVVLDPCCGTGAYLRAVLRRIAETLRDKGGDALVANDLKRAAMQRVFGFEILPAPFVVAHLQLGLELEHQGAPLSDRSDTPERVGVYLTNALTGWDPPKGKPKQIAFPGFSDERDAASKVKREEPILVILGNPPYNGFAGTAMEEERDSATAYRTTKRVAAPQGHGLNDLYVRFFRMAERRIVEKSGRGIVCFISNYSWLDGLSFTGMRERFLEVFSGISIDCLNGDKRKTGKLTPDGEPDPSVFSTDTNPAGIQVGTAIATLVRKKEHTGTADVMFRHFWGKNKRADLLNDKGDWEIVTPVLEMGLALVPSQTASDYFTWPVLANLLPVSFPGIKTSRDDLVVDIDRSRLERRMQQYFDPDVSHEEMRRIAPAAMADASGFKAKPTRELLIRRGFLPGNVVPFCYRPFDVRWLYWEPETKLLDRNRPDYVPHVKDGNLWIAAVQRNRKEFDPPLVSALHSSLHVIERGANLFPIYLFGEVTSLFETSGRQPNLSPRAADYLAGIGADPEALFFHALAVLHAPAYGSRNAAALRQDWPRIPLPQERDVLLASAALGQEVSALLDADTPVLGVTAGQTRDELKSIAVFKRVDGKPARPEAGDLDVTAGWGHAGTRGVTMPGKGKLVTRSDGTCDVFLNDVAYWGDVPQEVWKFTIGGYQVMKKWLSYREKPLLGRALTTGEVRHVTDMARRLAALIAMGSSLDSSYSAVIKTTCPWPER